MLRSIHAALSSSASPTEPISARAAAAASSAAGTGSAEPRWDQQIDTVESFRELFTKYEHMVPMRDGVKLHTTLYVPKMVRSVTRYGELRLIPE